MSDVLATLQRYRESAWDWATECVVTQDQADIKNPIKDFPNKEYLKLYFEVWEKEPLLAVPKSRRMFLSWATIALYTHDTIFNVGRHQGFVSKKEEDANDLVLRAKFILDNMKKKLPSELIPKYKHRYCHLEFPDINSKIQAFPSGADQIRQHTLSGMMFDEIAFWPDGEETYGAVAPLLEKNARITLISSAAPSFFKRLVFDELDR